MSHEHNFTLQDLEHLDLAEFDAADYLTNDEIITAFLTNALECGDVAHFADALKDVARARNMEQVALPLGSGDDAPPGLDAITRVLAALNMRLVVQAIPPDGQTAVRSEPMESTPA